MENQSNILFVAPGNLWLRLTTQQQWSNDAATAGTVAAVAVERVDTWVTYTPVLATGSGIDTNQRILNMELYINNIFVNPEIKC
jgi:hypothetical protein